jgi:hypothetical protein
LIFHDSFFGAHTEGEAPTRQLDFGVRASEDWTDTSRGTTFFVKGTSIGSTVREDWLTIVSGNVGIGKEDPNYKLEVKGPINSDVSVYNGVAMLVAGLEAISYQKNAYFSWGSGGKSNYFRNKVGIGIDNPESELEVNGKIVAKEIEVVLEGWPDFVFEENYNLKSIAELENFIKTYKHLPDVPSETAVKENGVNLGNMDSILLQKIEELTLYVIELEKKNKELTKRVSSLENTK